MEFQSSSHMIINVFSKPIERNFVWRDNKSRAYFYYRQIFDFFMGLLLPSILGHFASVACVFLFCFVSGVYVNGERVIDKHVYERSDQIRVEGDVIVANHPFTLPIRRYQFSQRQLFSVLV